MQGSPLYGPQASKPVLEKVDSQAIRSPWGGKSAHEVLKPHVHSHTLVSNLYHSTASDYMGHWTMV